MHGRLFMFATLLGMFCLSADVNAQQQEVDARADRRGTSEAVFGSTGKIHFLGTQVYPSDTLRIRIDGALIRYPSQGFIDDINSFGNGEELGIEANSFWDVTLLPGAYYAFSQLGEGDSAIVFEAGAMLMISSLSGSQEYRTALEEVAIGLEGNSASIRLVPSIGAVYIKSFDSWSLEYEISGGPLVPIWGNMSFGIPEYDGIQYDSSSYMSSGFMVNGLGSYRFSRWLITGGVRYMSWSLSDYEKVLCAEEGENDPGWCDGGSDLMPFTAVGLTFGR